MRFTKKFNKKFRERGDGDGVAEKEDVTTANYEKLLIVTTGGAKME